MLPPSKPFTRTMQKQEKDALQKWVQCARCNQWRKVGAVLALGGRKVLCACLLAARWQPWYSPEIPAAQLTAWQPDTARCGEPWGRSTGRNEAALAAANVGANQPLRAAIWELQHSRIDAAAPPKVPPLKQPPIKSCWPAGAV